MADLKKQRAELEKKKDKWKTEIKYHTEQIEGRLGDMERKTQSHFDLKKDAQGYYYDNDSTGEIEHHLKKIKAIFEDAENIEYKLQMDESDAEDEKNEKNANIKWADYNKVVGGDNARS